MRARLSQGFREEEEWEFWEAVLDSHLMLVIDAALIVTIPLFVWQPSSEVLADSAANFFAVWALAMLGGVIAAFPRGVAAWGRRHSVAVRHVGGFGWPILFGQLAGGLFGLYAVI